MRSPNAPVIGPITGHNVGADAALVHSPNVALWVSPMPRAAVAAPERAVVRSAYNWSMEYLTVSSFTGPSVAFISLALGLRP